VVTPSYNQGRFLEEALRSVAEQQYPAVEHLVVDGGSADQSVQILKEYSGRPGWKHLRWISEPDRGQSDALNKGFRMATGDIVGWLNSDDRYASGCFQKVAEVFAAKPEVELLYGDYNWMDEFGRIIKIRREIDFNSFVLFYNRICFIQSSAALFLRRGIFEAGHFLDERYHYAMDYEFYLRLATNGIRFEHIREVLGSFRWHASSKSTISSDMGRRELKQARALYAPELSGLRGRRVRNFSLAFLTGLATIVRWSGKIARGCYRE
jgi:glycosyltransferase involved in cell wall biosynthesis